ncbi:S-DNA-T family DNA segregation ATPase FtsK/SpoIIIE [Actinoplanes octamycinicus]|uniref:S-DNA-T family DNA segregation ATPase FtsK/SpoIIIE n=1 Tax=Actinoplanes octamycinicus TaxID=135948 RepID=A0A7W7GYY8_9ACTN|nr:FtsK/SpoIIIE domain-containing protein [Actinoplanes octamycinicus]MBB4740886.1 S-DNA-T family DNA segregation ATPase FtsK/SpoIIIE [Actinoplanes octamycinicus]GIE55793.1 cell division protein FtsK [Actinoplanes octamycinicus]
MHIIYAPGGREIEVRPRSREATLADLLRAIGVPDPGVAGVDGHPVATSTPIEESGLHEGAVLDLAPAPPSGPPVPAPQEMVLVAGLAAGRAFPLPPGHWVVGRGPAAGLRLDHDTVSREHCLLTVTPPGPPAPGAAGTVTVTDLGAANGVQRNGVTVTEPVTLTGGDVLGVGAVALSLRPGGERDRPAGLDLRRHLGRGGTVSFNRPPRVAPPERPGPLTAPGEPREPAEPHFSVASTLGPLVLAVVMVAITRDIRFGLFAVLSPLIGIGTYLESRRRNRKETAEGQRTFDEGLAELESGLARAGEQERARLRSLLGDPAETLRRAALPSTRLWERRPRHDDFLLLYAGIADTPWQPEVTASTGRLPDRVRELTGRAVLRAAPVPVALGGGGIVGIAGDRAAALAVARSLLCQAAVHHGPADLTVAVLVDDGREPEWDWCKWLPHTRLPDDSGRWLSHRRETSEAMARQLAAGGALGTALVVLDSDVLTEGTRAPARDLLNQARPATPDPLSRAPAVPVAGIVLAASVDRLPAACDTVIQILDPDGDAVVRRPAEGTAVDDVLLAGLAVAEARACARDLARFDDPEVRRTGAGLPDGVRLLPMIGLAQVDATSVRERWQRADPVAITAPLGVTDRGVFTLDLIRDGPHGLIGGTTGSGKSELLRSLVAALAANADPARLTFVLMDYKGGAAFDECARLPHTVGMVTDLDEQLGERALRALEAELRHRERRLREVRCDNLVEYVRSGAAQAEPMPRLVVVIDEFATMAKELPDFLTALVGIAQRGRTLGVHLILATQRPSGAVNDNIRTNTNLRIALRVQDAADSVDVIGIREAAELSRLLPGRAYVRLGPGEVVPIQTALVTAVSGGGDDAPVAVTAFTFGAVADGGAAGPRTGNGVEQRTDLARLVDAIAEAASDLPAPRRPWPEPLGGDLDLATLPPEPGRATVALADDPDRQAQYPVGWDPAEGNLLLFGITGSGTTTTLQALALSLAVARGPDQLELYAIDYGTGDLGILEGLPHTGAVVAADDRERQVRLIRHLRAELDRRRTAPGGPRRTIIVLIDNLAAMRAEFDDIEGLTVLDTLTRLYGDGTAAGIGFAVTADRFSTVPPAWTSVTTQRWLFRLPDPYDYVQAGLGRKDVPARLPGRMVTLPEGLQAQVGRPSPGPAAMVAAVAAKYPDAVIRAARIGVLPTSVLAGDLPPPALDDEPWRLPVGIRESDLEAARLVLYEGDHALIAGPARCGKSTVLLSLAAVLRGRAHLAGTGGRRSPLRDCADLDRFAPAGGAAAALLADLRTVDGPAVLFIDDAEGFDDADGAIAGLLSAGRPELHVVVAGRADALRSLYGHWTQTIRRSKAGLLLRPNIDLDGDLLGVTLPRRAPVRLGVGRGYLIHNGEWDIVQAAVVLNDHDGGHE